MAEDLDARARARALDPRQSFIVRAPAGAGKTELLVQRYLALLATASSPEAIVAITFTVKAAGEMRARILNALTQAQQGIDAPSEHGRRTLALALAALERDAAQGWRLAENPARLQIQTIDALCLRLARRLPVLARTQADLRITERPRPLYRAAAQMLLDEIEEQEHGERLASLLLQLDGDEHKLVELIADMLAERDRWLRHVARTDAPGMQRAVLEDNLAALVRERLESIAALTPAWVAEALPLLAAQAARAADARSPIRACAALTALPPPAPGALAAWQGIAELLLTADGALRRQPRLGAGPGLAPLRVEDRAALQGLLDRLAGSSDFINQLSLVRKLPQPVYDDAQWQSCAALVALLPRAAACLKLAFAEAGVVDFTEIAHAALRALGEADAPTDLALILDQRIEHLLVDEFQDTSFTQLDLLARLTAGWSHGDGRSLFLVGDPMQSIYRFREAEVALFARVERQGLGALALVPLQLTRNFRAQAGLVEWVNSRFAMLFPPARDGHDEAVRFTPAESVRAALDGAAVSVQAQAFGDHDGEARAVLELIVAARREQPQASIAVLVRAREHLSSISRALHGAGLAFRAVDVQPLAVVPVVQDLHALTRALLHLGDRVAWLAILRAPWCGLTLADLHALAHQREHTVWEAIVDERVRGRLSEDGQRRLSRLKRVLADSLAERGRQGLRAWIEGTWTALGGSACIATDNEWANAQRYLRLLAELDRGGEPARLEELDEALAELYADADPAADERLQLMTIHRAKGLEFDVVIVPSLGRAPGRRAERLLAVHEHADANGSRLLVAPMSAPGQANTIGRYLQHLEDASDDEEAVRLLYVAATRARGRLHLLGAARVGAREALPRRDSLLARLWPAVHADFAVLPAPAAAGTTASLRADTRASIRRLPSSWVLPVMPQVPPWRGLPEPEAAEEAPEFAWAGDVARQVGRAVHRALERIGKDGVACWNGYGAQGQRTRLRGLLSELGVPRRQLEQAVERAHRAVQRTLEDARGRWILEHAHVDAQSERELSAWLDERLVTAVLDRTFVDEQGVRWIVDFKTGVHEGAGLETFLDEEVERYRPQLERYARVMRRLDARPLRVGLYFPLLSAWREWEP